MGSMIVGVVYINTPNTVINPHVVILPLFPVLGHDDDVFMPRKLFNQRIVRSTIASMGGARLLSADRMPASFLVRARSSKWCLGRSSKCRVVLLWSYCLY